MELVWPASTPLGIGVRTSIVVWVVLTGTVAALVALVGFSLELLVEPAPGEYEPGVVEAAFLGVILGIWLAGIAQILFLPLSLLVGVGDWARLSRRRRAQAGRARRGRGGSR